MAKNELFGKRIDPACSYCEHSRPLDDGIQLVCRHKGRVEPSGRCWRFRYDPLRRVPTPQATLQGGFDKEDFSL